MEMASNKIKYLIFLWVLISLPLIDKLWSMPFYMMAIILVGVFLFIKWPKTGYFVLPVLFLLTLHENKLFSPFYFDWEKMFVGNKNYLVIIQKVFIWLILMGILFGKIC